MLRNHIRPYSRACIMKQILVEYKGIEDVIYDDVYPKCLISQLWSPTLSFAERYQVRTPPPSKMAQSQTTIPPAQKTMRKFEKGIYIATDVRWGMALDLSCGDFRSLIAYGFHGAENQQARTFFFLHSAATMQKKLIVSLP